MRILEIIELENQNNKADSLKLLEILDYRENNLSIENKKLLSNLRKGNDGELEAIQFIKEYGLSHWRIIRNYWGDYNGRFESDLILITSTSCYVFEVKNYFGKFTYNNGHSSIDEFELTSDCIFQTRRSYKNIRNILQDEVHPSNVHGVLLFIGEHNDVYIESLIDDIEIVKRSGFMRFIQRIVQDEHAYHGNKISIHKIEEKLLRHAISNPFDLPALTFSETQKLRKGISCCECQSFAVEISRNFITCLCGNVENRREAMIRTICEYGALTYNQPLIAKHLYDFIADDTSYSFLFRILSTYFRKEDIPRIGFYNNENIYSHYKGN